MAHVIKIPVTEVKTLSLANNSEITLKIEPIVIELKINLENGYSISSIGSQSIVEEKKVEEEKTAWVVPKFNSGKKMA